MPRTSLIVVNYNTADRTTRLVEQTLGGVDEVIVVDNASQKGDARTLATLAAQHGHVRFLSLPDNRGYGAGANAGARVASGEILVVANPDIDVDPAAFQRLAAALSEARVGLAAPRFLNPDGTLQRSAHRRDPGLMSTIFELCRPVAGAAVRLRRGWHPTLLSADEHLTSRDCSHVLGALVAVRREAFDAVAGFDEDFFLYREETDLCRRLRAAGWRIRHVGEATAVHESGASTPDGTPAMYRSAYLASHYRFIAKHRGRTVAALARLLGTLSCVVWLALGPKRALARAPLRWHLGLRDPEG